MLQDETTLGFVLNPEKKEEWIKAFREQPLPILLLITPTPDETEQAAEHLVRDIQATNETIFRRRRPFHPKASPWWNAACATATQNLRRAQDAATKAVAQARLKGTVRAAKRKWADEYIEKSQLWDVAAWRHG